MKNVSMLGGAAHFRSSAQDRSAWMPVARAEGVIRLVAVTQGTYLEEGTKMQPISLHRRVLPPKRPISQEALDQLFREARTHSTWLSEPVPVELLRQAYEFDPSWADQCQRLACQIRFSNHSRRQGTPEASSGSRQCRQNHVGFR